MGILKFPPSVKQNILILFVCLIFKPSDPKSFSLIISVCWAIIRLNTAFKRILFNMGDQVPNIYSKQFFMDIFLIIQSTTDQSKSQVSIVQMEIQAISSMTWRQHDTNTLPIIESTLVN